MGTFYTDEQIQEAITALESHSPGIWKTMIRIAPMTDPLNEELELARTAVSRAFIVTFPKLPFIAQAEDETKALAKLTIDIGNAVRATIAAAKNGSNSTPSSKKD